MANILYVKFTQAEFEARYGISLDKAVVDEDQDGKVTRFIARAVEKVTDYIAANDNYLDAFTLETTAQLTTNQAAIINRAAMMQAKYMLDNGDFGTVSGYSAVSNTKTLTDQDIAHIQVCQEAKNLLNDRIIDRSI